MDVEIANCECVLEDYAFESCGIRELSVSESTIEIGKSAFSYCDDLAKTEFKNSVVEISEYAFYDTGDDMELIFTSCTTDVDDYAFASCGVLTINADDGKITVGESAFSYCDDLTDITIEADSLSLGSYSFYNCSSLMNVTLAADSEEDSPAMVIDENAFSSSSVQNVILSQGSIELGDSAFSYCEDLTNVEIGGNLSKIGEYAFFGCPDKLAIKYGSEVYNSDTIEDAE